MSNLTGDSEYGSTSASPLLPMTFSPENENMTAPQPQSPNLEPLSSWENGSNSDSMELILPTFVIPTSPQSLSPNLEPLSSWDHGSNSDSLELILPTFVIPTAPQSLSPNREPLSSWEHGSNSALTEIQTAETIPPTFEILTAPQSQSPNMEPLSSWEHGSNSAFPEIQTAETIPPSVKILTTPQYQFKYGPGTEKLLSIQTKENYIKYGMLFYHAAISGDWGSATRIIAMHPEIVRARITGKSETGLHIAAAAKNLSFVRRLVEKMTPVDLLMTNNSLDTALCFAAASGIVDIAKEMVKKNSYLPLMRGKGGMTPLHMAAELGHRDMVKYLLPLTDLPNGLTDEECVQLFISLINTNLYDIALDILEKYPTLATARDKHMETALHVLARKPLSSKVHQDRGEWKGLTSSGFSILVGNSKGLLLVSKLWKIAVQLLDDSDISELIRGPTPLLFVATESGNVEFITILIKFYPDLIWKVDHRKRSMFHVAVDYRQESIFKIIYEIGAIKDLIARLSDYRNNNMLHLADKLAPSNRLGIVSGAALQLQRELMWFKEVEKIVQPSYTEMKNADDLTPKELFDKDHIELRKEGEAWMKTTAQSSMVVATLITTVMFAAAFTLPKMTMDNGAPNYLKKPSFLIFLIFDSLSLFSSTASTLMFLSILTSRYKMEDFLHSLPQKLILGLLTLSMSIVTMMVAFTASMFIVFPEKSNKAAIAISCMAGMPVTIYILLQFQLLADFFSSTYNSKFVFHSEGKNLSLYQGLTIEKYEM